MTIINYTQSSYDPDAVLEPGIYSATVTGFRSVYDSTDCKDYVEVQWDINDFTITEKFKINSPKERTKGFFQWKLGQLAGVLGLPPIPKKKPGEDINCDIQAVGKSCMVEIEHFITDRGNAIATIKKYMAAPPSQRQYPEPKVHLPQKPDPMGEMMNDEIPF